MLIDYEEDHPYNIMTDFFSEPCRMKCKKYNRAAVATRPLLLEPRYHLQRQARLRACERIHVEERHGLPAVSDHGRPHIYA